MEADLPRNTAIFLATIFVLSTIATGVVAAEPHEMLTQDERPGAWHIPQGLIRPVLQLDAAR
jgi:hypothetical protein